MLTDKIRELYYLPSNVVIPILLGGAFIWIFLLRGIYRRALIEDSRMQSEYHTNTSFRWGSFLGYCNAIQPSFFLGLGMPIAFAGWVIGFFSGEMDFSAVLLMIPAYYFFKLQVWICRRAIGRARWAFLFIVAWDSLYFSLLPIQWAVLFPVGNLLYIALKWKSLGRDTKRLNMRKCRKKPMNTNLLKEHYKDLVLTRESAKQQQKLKAATLSTTPAKA